MSFLSDTLSRYTGSSLRAGKGVGGMVQIKLPPQIKPVQMKPPPRTSAPVPVKIPDTFKPKEEKEKSGLFTTQNILIGLAGMGLLFSVARPKFKSRR